MTRRALQIKRVYEAPSADDGLRILVDRLWPRGLTKERAAVDVWLKDVAPSNELRKSFGHDPAKWEDFQQQYKAELESNNEAVDRLRAELKKGRATILYGAKDEAHNEAVVLVDWLGSTTK